MIEATSQADKDAEMTGFIERSTLNNLPGVTDSDPPASSSPRICSPARNVPPR